VEYRCFAAQLELAIRLCGGVHHISLPNTPVLHKSMHNNDLCAQVEYAFPPNNQPVLGKLAYSIPPTSEPKSVPYLHIAPSSATTRSVLAVLHTCYLLPLR
jgi:hypothetical protein